MAVLLLDKRMLPGMRFSIITITVLVYACSNLPPPRQEPPPFPIALELAEQLKKERAHYDAMVRRSIKSVVRYFRKHGFEVKPETLIDRAIIYANQAVARSRLAKRFGIPQDKVPPTFAGTVDKKTLLLVTPAVYERAYTKLYPGYRFGPHEFERLIVHELTHRAHALIAQRRFGTEDGMGPRWLFEGLAITACGQWATGHRHLDWATIAEIIKDDAQKKSLSYPRYGRLFRSLLASFPLRFLVERSMDKDLVEVLKKDYLPSYHRLEHPIGRSRGTVLLVHGSAPFNADGRVPTQRLKARYSKHTFFADLAASLRRQGWSVLRYHKPGVSWQGINRAIYATTDVATLCRQLRSLWRFMPSDKPRVVFAWSEGSLHVRALPQDEIDAVILLGGIATKLADVIRAQGGPSEATLRKDLAGKARTTMLGIDRPVGRVLDELDLEENWRLFVRHPRRPLLVLHGKLDKQVPSTQAAIWHRVLQKNKHERYRLRILPGRDHRLMPLGRYEVKTLASEITAWLDKLPIRMH